MICGVICVIRIILVDDEKQVLSGLTNLINWNEEGFEIVGIAHGYYEALELFEEKSPDVVITDIVMQDGNGIDLLKKVKEKKSDTEVIIFTGYADFDYIKSAIDNDTSAFLLKPVSSFELMRALKKVKGKYRKKTKQNEYELLRRLIDCKTNMQNDELVVQYGEKLKSDFFVVVAQIDNCSQDEKEKYYGYLCDFFDEVLYEHYPNIICRIDSKHIVIMFYNLHRYEMNVICKFLSTKKISFTRKYGLSVTLGISEIYKDIKDTHNAYQQAIFAVSQKALKGYGDTIYYDSKSKNIKDNPLSISVFFGVDDLNMIITGLKKHNSEVVFYIVDRFFNKIKNADYVNMEFFKGNIKDIIIQLFYIFRPSISDQKKYFGYELNPITDIDYLELIVDIYEFFKKILTMILETNREVAGNVSGIIQEVYSYVALNYQTSIRIDDMADSMHIDKNSLMREFKKETGFTIGEYITNYRIDMAKTLIESDKFYVNEISYYVGYTDTKYFSKVFRKIVGCTPTEYQRSIKNK